MDLGEPLRGRSARSRRAMRSITFAHFMRSVVPLLSLSLMTFFHDVFKEVFA
jgi:hypothetical protein